MSFVSFRRALAVALFIGAAVPAHAAAQQCTTAIFRSVSASPPNVTFTPPTVVDYDNQGVVYGSTVTVNVTSSLLGFIPLSWSLCLNADTPNLGSSPDGVTKALSDLQVDLHDANWRPLTVSQQRIGSGNGNATVQLRVRMRLSWDADPPGSFGTVMRFTVGS